MDHRTRIDILTGQSPQMLDEYYRLTSWTELASWHKKYGQHHNIDKLFVLYNAEAKKKMSENNLDEKQRWMLNLP